jgi:hypothetical protein
MPRSRKSHDAISSQGRYSFAWLSWLAGETPKPFSGDYGISPKAARRERLRVDNVVARAYDQPPEEPQPDPEAFGVSPERGSEIYADIDRLARLAHDRREAS